MSKSLFLSVLFFSLVSIGLPVKAQTLKEKDVKHIQGLWLLYSADLTAADGTFNRFDLSSKEPLAEELKVEMMERLSQYIPVSDFTILKAGKGEMEFVSFGREQHYQFGIAYLIYSVGEKYFLRTELMEESETFEFEITQLNKKRDQMTLMHQDRERVSTFTFYKQD